MRELITKSPLETKRLSKILLKEIIEKRIIALVGELGSGKTTFLQGLSKEIGIKEKILSSTFVILRKYKIKNKKLKIERFYHIDCYRIEGEKEILKIGFQKIISDKKNLVAIEWAEKIKKILPQNTLWLKFEIISRNSRKIIIF